jgi:ElaB/YqjD/DUF883 family membrane-anchored ribosome-binding protein
MSQNRPDNDKGNTSGASGGTGSTGSSGGFGGASSGATDAGTTRDTSLSTSGGGGGAGTSGGVTGPYSGSGAAAATAPDKGGIAAKAKEYGQTVAGAASTAKDYLSDKASVVTDKIQGLRDVDYEQVATQAKDYARQNPGQALLVAAAAGFVIGLLVRGGRR